MTPSRWQQIEELYHAALECEHGERATLLDRADPELRREVAVKDFSCRLGKLRELPCRWWSTGRRD